MAGVVVPGCQSQAQCFFGLYLPPLFRAVGGGAAVCGGLTKGKDFFVVVAVSTVLRVSFTDWLFLFFTRERIN